MGNKQDKSPYIAINGNTIECDDFDNMEIKSGTNVKDNSDTNPKTNSDTKSNSNTKPNSDTKTNSKRKNSMNTSGSKSGDVELLEKLKKEVDSMGLNGDLAKIFLNYNEEIILNYYESDSAINIFKQNNEKSLSLALQLPKSDRGLMFKYFPSVPFKLILVMAKNINFNAVNANGEIFLYKYNDVAGNLKHTCEIIEAIDDININLVVKNMTFFETLIRDGVLTNNEKKLVEFFEILEKKKYNFNKCGYHKDTFLTQMLVNMPKATFNLANTMKLESFDITTESRWLFHILKHELIHLHNYIYHMFLRENYVKLFLGLYSNLYVNVWGNKFIIFLKKAVTINEQKTIDCLHYKNEKGNTIIHLMADYHDKQTLQFCVRYFHNKLNVGVNNDGKTPLTLYNESDFKTVLQLAQ